MATLDDHADVSPAMAGHVDALVGYRTYPHVDQPTRSLEAAGLMVRAVRGEVRPVVALAKPPMILNLLGKETDRNPMRSLLERAREAERRPGLLSVSLMAGFPYSDVPEMGPAVTVVGDADRSAAQAAADELAGRMWEVRRGLFVACPGPEEAVHLAMQSDRPPVVLVDRGTTWAEAPLATARSCSPRCSAGVARGERRALRSGGVPSCLQGRRRRVLRTLGRRAGRSAPRRPNPFVPCALFHLGDAHAAMGHGELSATGLEIPAEMTVTIGLRERGRPPGPRIESPEEIMAIACGCPMERSIAQSFAHLIL